MPQYLTLTLLTLALAAPLSAQRMEFGGSPTLRLFLNQGDNEIGADLIAHNYVYAGPGLEARITRVVDNRYLREVAPALFRNRLSLDLRSFTNNGLMLVGTDVTAGGFSVCLPLRFGWRRVKPANGTVHDRLLGFGVVYNQFQTSGATRGSVPPALRAVLGSFNKLTPFLDATLRKRYDRLSLQLTAGTTLLRTQKNFVVNGETYRGGGWSPFVGLGLGYWFGA